MSTEEARSSHRATIVGLVFLTAVTGGAAPLIAAIGPRALLPWAIVAALAVGAAFRRPRQVDLFEPFAYLSWTHYAPAFVVGTFLLATGVVVYPYSGLVRDPVAACALALVYVIAGCLALGLGSRSRVAAACGRRLSRLLPAPPAKPTIPMAAILLLAGLGLAASYGAFQSGIVGYALARAARPFDAALSYGAALLSLAQFLFWFRWFDARQGRPPGIALALPLLLIGSSMVLWGNRGMLLSCFLVGALAFRFARGPLSLAQNAAIVALAFVALSLGMVYGSVFRRLKGGETGTVSAATVTPPPSEATGAPAPPATDPSARPASDAPGPPGPGEPAARADSSRPVAGRPPVASPAVPAGPSLERQLAISMAAAETIVQRPASAGFAAILAGAGQRLNLLSDVSVTIARYRDLRGLEPQHGIADLWTTTWTSFIPRALWPGKPRVGDARAYAQLYFGWNGNSYATTPAADLVRNVGPWLLPLGMAIFGVVLGALRAALVDGGSRSIGERAALFSMLVWSVNLESSYGLLLPSMLRVGVVAVSGLGLVRLVGRLRERENRL